MATETLYQGNLVETGNAFDMAIEGRGFEVLMHDGNQAFTRDGSFQVDAQGQLVTSSGFVVQPAITIPERSVHLCVGDGVVVIPGSSIATQVGNLQVAALLILLAPTAW